MDRTELLMKEYETITTQIVHWDTFFWAKNNFFLTIESVLLAVIVTRLSTELIDNVPMKPELFFVGVFIILFNLLLCYIWFRTNRSNHEYLKVRFNRAFQIEADSALEGVVNLYHFQKNMLNDPKYAKHSSSWWEIHLPFAFMIAWFASLIAAAFDSQSLVSAITAGLTVIFVIGITIFIERTGWPRPLREKTS